MTVLCAVDPQMVRFKHLLGASNITISIAPTLSQSLHGGWYYPEDNGVARVGGATRDPGKSSGQVPSRRRWWWAPRGLQAGVSGAPLAPSIDNQALQSSPKSTALLQHSVYHVTDGWCWESGRCCQRLTGSVAGETLSCPQHSNSTHEGGRG